jgi:hypothetical protein
MNFDRRRERVVTRLVDGFYRFGGDTITRSGESLRGTPGFAVSQPWQSSATTLPHRRYVARWYDETGSEPFIAANRVAALVAHVEEAGGVPLTQHQLANFAQFTPAYGVWQTPRCELSLAVSLVIPDEAAARWWGHVLGQAAIYDLLAKRVIWLDGRDGEEPPAALLVPPCNPCGGPSCTRTRTHDTRVSVVPFLRPR